MRLSSTIAAIGLAAYAAAQCPNEIAQYNFNSRTMSANNTWFVVPVPKSAALAALKESFPTQTDLVLLDVPANELPGFQGNDLHPLLVYSGYGDDIRMNAAQIEGALLSNTILVSYVGKGSSTAALGASVATIIGGTEGSPLQPVAGVVPAIVASLLEGTITRVGDFIPDNAAYQSNNNGLYSSNGKAEIVRNGISGPGLYQETLDVLFTQAARPKYTLKQLKKVINQPQLLNGVLSGLCARNAYYFNNATAQPYLRNGNVTLGPGANGLGTSNILQNASPDHFGNYYNVDGVSACTQTLGNNPQPCNEAAAQVDPAAL